MREDKQTADETHFKNRFQTCSCPAKIQNFLQTVQLITPCSQVETSIHVVHWMTERNCFRKTPVQIWHWISAIQNFITSLPVYISHYVTTSAFLTHTICYKL